MEFSYLTPTYQGLYTITAKSNTITAETLFGPPPNMCHSENFIFAFTFSLFQTAMKSVDVDLMFIP